MGRLLRFRPMGYGLLAMLVVLVLSSCGTEQGGPTGEENPAKPVTREVTKTVTVAEAPSKEKATAPETARATPAPPKTARSVSATIKDAPAYVTVADGILSIEVPSSWDEVATGKDSEGMGSSWSDFAGESVEASLTAASSLDSWDTVPGSQGVYAVASEGLAQRYADEELVAAGPNDLSGTCEAGVRSAFERGPYSGLVQEWGSCGEAGGDYLTLAAAPQGRECVVLLQVGTAAQEGAEAGQHALDTFGADCAAAASYPLASADEQYATEQDAEDSEPTTPTPQYEEGEYTTNGEPPKDPSDEVDCSGFTTMSGEPSRWQAQQFYDFVATPKERAILDPDGDGFACDDSSSKPEGTADEPETPGPEPPESERTQYEPETTEPEVSEPPPGDEERVPPPTDQYDPLEPSPQDPGNEETDEPPVPSEPPPSSSGYPPFPGDPFDGPTCDEVGGGPYSVPQGSPRDSNGDGVACE